MTYAEITKAATNARRDAQHGIIQWADYEKLEAERILAFKAQKAAQPSAQANFKLCRVCQINEVMRGRSCCASCC